MSTITVEKLIYFYDKTAANRKAAIQDISFSIASGAFIGVIGHTGSGKSTLIQHLNGLLKPDSGRVLIDGQDIWADKSHLRQVRFDVGLVFQYPEYQLFEETVERDIAFGPKNMGLSDMEINARVQEAAEFTGISTEILKKSPFELSGGQKRRVAIAGILAMRPKVLILDEPTAGLDPSGRQKILSQIAAYHQNRKTTVLLISHNMDDVAEYCDKLLVLKDGTVHQFDTPNRIFATGEMDKIGLSAPHMSRLMRRLRELGVPVDTNIFTVSAARQEILRLAGKEQL